MTLIKAAKSIVKRWDTPLWKDAPATATYILALRKAIKQAKKQEPVAWRLKDDESGYYVYFGADEIAGTRYAREVKALQPLYAHP